MTTSDLILPVWLVLPVYAGVCLAAIWQGEWPERTLGIAKPIAAAMTAIFKDVSYSQPQWVGMAADILLLAVALFVAFRSDKYWPMWLAGFQLLAILTHTAELLDPTVGAWAYVTAGALWTYLGTAALAVGVWGCMRRRAALRQTRLSNVIDPDA